VAAEDAMDTLVEAGLFDVALIDLRDDPDQRDCEWLVVATGRSRQHALAGAIDAVSNSLHALLKRHAHDHA
jgi:ribosomal silencing factor RsfS